MSIDDDNYNIGDTSDRDAGIREDKSYLDALYEQCKKLESETLEQKKERFEKLRVEALRKIMTGHYKTEMIETRVFSLLLSDLYFTPKSVGMKCQDVFLDRQQNTALHYALHPAINGSLEIYKIENLVRSFIDLEVINAAVNPHQKNLLGKSSIDHIHDMYYLKMVECATMLHRQDVYDKDEFAARRNYLMSKRWL